MRRAGFDRLFFYRFARPRIARTMRLMDLRPVLYVIGILLLILTASMIIPLLTDLMADNDDWRVFLGSMLFTGFVGGSMVLTHAGRAFTISLKQTFLLTTVSWLFLAFFSALPFVFSGLDMSMADAIFEAVSGLTTTGATVIVGLEYAPPGILIWRALLQWMGGVGIIVMALSVLPMLKVGGMQLFRSESSQKEKAFPRARQLASGIGLLYLGLTFLCAVGYAFNGMAPFDAVAHAMTTIATGGFSTFDTSFAHYDTAGAETVAIIFMLASALPFVLYLKALRGAPGLLWQDSQVRAFLGVVFVSVTATALYLIYNNDLGIGESLRRSAFNVVSIITGTGFVNHDYGLWGHFPTGILLFLMVMGGCVGSTTCGIKIFRFQILTSVAYAQIRRLIYPNAVAPPRFNGKIVPTDVTTSVMSFFFIFALCFAVLAMGLSATGLDFITSVSGAASAISNVGPGLGDTIGAIHTYKFIPDAAKWLLCAGMILGRLELFTVLVLFLPSFWRN